VLLNRATADGIADGGITLVLRRWETARVKPGGTQRTSAGTIRIDDVAEYPPDYRVTDDQARRAGYPDADAAMAQLDRRGSGAIYAVAVSYMAPDERPALAADDHLTTDDVAAIAARLDRWDAASRGRRWTRETLALIAANEAVRAPDLAARTGFDTVHFKRNVRKLKGLGLTISLDVGYRISPRGMAFLRQSG
jgi:hypothetical protein